MWSLYFKDNYTPLLAGSIDGTDEIPHDRGIIRASAAKYKPNLNAVKEGNSKCTLFVGRLSLKTNDETLKEYFSQFGTLIGCKVIRDIITGFSKGYGFVEFDKERNADIAYQECNGDTLDNAVIFVDYECCKTLKGWVPRRLGGGLGGKKESGQLRFGGRDRPFQKPILEYSSTHKHLPNDRSNDEYQTDRLHQTKRRSRSRDNERFKDKHGRKDSQRLSNSDRKHTTKEPRKYHDRHSKTSD